METTIGVNTGLLNSDILEGIKKLFSHKPVDIIIQTAADTDYILSNPFLKQEL